MEQREASKADESAAELGYLVLRVCLGTNIAMHGIVRLITGPGIFVAGLVKQFQHTFLPLWSVQAFGYTLPWVEGAVGLLVLAGLFTQPALVGGGLVIAVLTFGISVVQQWDTAGIQLVYAIAFSGLLLLIRYNRFSLDRRLGRSPLHPSKSLLVIFAVSLSALSMGSSRAYAAIPQKPVLVELFTSEGCSSCPPADAMLAQISKETPGVIVLSEHVNYWNYLGWTDPFSSTDSTNRQAAYAQQFGGEGPYTPQMVVNGERQFVGGDRASWRTALAAEAQKPGLPLSLLQLKNEEGARAIRVRVSLGQSDASGRIIAVLVQNEGRQQVSRGENGGRVLEHVAIAREFKDLGNVPRGLPFDQETSFDLPAGGQAKDFHIVVFVQKAPGGPIVASASTR